MSKEIRSIQKLIKPRAPKSSRVTSTKLMEKNEANDERKSKVLMFVFRNCTCISEH